MSNNPCFPDRSKDHSSRVIGTGGSCIDKAYDLEVTPTTLNFDTTDVGESSTKQTIFIKNKGFRALTDISIEWSGTFAVQHSAPANLKSDDGFEIEVSFTPQFVGTSSGYIVIRCAEFNVAAVISLHGEGTGEDAPTPEMANYLRLGQFDTPGQGSYRANGNRIQDLGTPVAPADAVRKQDMLEALADLAVDGSGQFVVDLLADTVSPENGAAMIGRGVVTVDSIADLLALPPGARRGDLRYLVRGYHAGSDVGGGEFYWDAASTEDDNGGTVFEVSGVTAGRFKRQKDSPDYWDYEFGIMPDGTDQGAAYLRAITYVAGLPGVTEFNVSAGVVYADAAKLYITVRDSFVIRGHRTTFINNPGSVSVSTDLFRFSPKDGSLYSLTLSGELTLDGNGRANGDAVSLAGVSGQFTPGEAVIFGNNFAFFAGEHDGVYYFQRGVSGNAVTLQTGDSITGEDSGATATVAATVAIRNMDSSAALRVVDADRVIFDGLKTKDPVGDGCRLLRVKDAYLTAYECVDNIGGRLDLLITSSWNRIFIKNCILPKISTESTAHRSDWLHQIYASDSEIRFGFANLSYDPELISPTVQINNCVLWIRPRKYDDILTNVNAHVPAYIRNSKIVQCANARWIGETGRIVVEDCEWVFSYETIKPATGLLTDVGETAANFFGSASPSLVRIKGTRFSRDLGPSYVELNGLKLQWLFAMASGPADIEVSGCEFDIDIPALWMDAQRGRRYIRGNSFFYDPQPSDTYLGNVYIRRGYNLSNVNYVEAAENAVYGEHASVIQGIQGVNASSGWTEPLTIYSRGNRRIKGSGPLLLLNQNTNRIMAPYGSSGPNDLFVVLSVDDQGGDASPETGHWVAGTRVLKRVPIPGQEAGYVCTATGSPGVWKKLPNIEA